MANTFAPFGFIQAYRLGGAPTEQPNRKYISSTNTTAIYFGDPVSLSSGYIVAATPGTTAIDGIFAGCSWNSSAAKKVIYNRAWLGLTSDVVLPSSGATGFEITATIVDDPLMVFKVQSQQTTTGTPSGTPPYGPSIIGQNVQFATTNAPSGQPSSLLGNSVASIDVSTAATTTTLPFRIIDLIRDPTGAPGTDFTAVNALMYVAFNNQAWRQLGVA